MKLNHPVNSVENYITWRPATPTSFFFHHMWFWWFLANLCCVKVTPTRSDWSTIQPQVLWQALQKWVIADTAIAPVVQFTTAWSKNAWLVAGNAPSTHSEYTYKKKDTIKKICNVSFGTVSSIHASYRSIVLTVAAGRNTFLLGIRAEVY